MRGENRLAVEGNGRFPLIALDFRTAGSNERQRWARTQHNQQANQRQPCREVRG
jgi:hypothetical protein